MANTGVALPPGASARRVLWPYALGILAVAVAPFVIWPPLLTRVTASDFLPHRFCYLSNPSLVWLHVTSDMMIGVAYVAISATLAYFVHRTRRDIPFSWMFLAFGLFIVACGGTHFMEVLTVWKPFYWLAGDVKLITAFASVATALALPRLIPRTVELLTAARISAQQKEQIAAANVKLAEFERMGASLSSRAAAGMANWDWDVRTDQVYWSGKVEAVFGRDATSLSRSEGVFASIHPDDRGRVREELQRCMTEGTEFDREFRVLWPDGSTHWLIGRGHAYFDQDHQPLRMIGVNIDITSRKLSEAALRQSEKLAVAGRLAASIAHEINNPLASITNLLFLARESSAADSPARQYTELAERELARVAQIVRQTLGFYRDPNKPESVRLSEVVDSVLDLHVAQLRSRKIEVVKQYQTDEAILGRSGELRQVFANLIANAIDAMPEGGCLRLEVAAAKSWRQPSVPGVRVTVADNGRGMTPEQRSRIFEPFFTTKGERGTGLGLWVSLGIVENHGGGIRARSSTRPGRQGTIMTVFLPKDRRTQPRTEMTTMASSHNES